MTENHREPDQNSPDLFSPEAAMEVPEKLALKAVRVYGLSSALERSRLMREDTLCHESLTEAERRWLRKNRPAEAKHWRLLTDLWSDKTCLIIHAQFDFTDG
jgi:hypothetical protein